MVIASGGWIQNAVESNHDKMYATGILICHDNSYPFQERTLSLEQPVKIGRSVARARAATDNAIFDCKVLSRNHAVLWYDSGKFYLKDTKSSNGTFVNNKRLSPSGEESVACEICSGDVVQFGVDVVESTKKVTHGCIVATLKLYLPDGKEAKASLSNSVTYINVTLEDLYKLNQFIQEAGRRENALRSKLEYMQQLLEHTRDAANQSWKALILEDCLLSRLEMLESQVITYSKNFGEDKLRNELVNLLEDKVQYQNATKELLQKKIQEKREIFGKVLNLKCRLSETEEETQSLHSLIKDNQNELQELAMKYIKVQQALQDMTEKLNKTKIKLKEVIQQSEKDKDEYMKKLEEQKNIEKNLQISLRDSKLDTVNIHKQISALRNYMLTLQDVTNEPFNSKSHVNPIEVINIILSKWNSMYVAISDKEIQLDVQDNQLNCTDNDSKFNKLTSIIDKSSSNQHCINPTLLENDYILPPIPSTVKSLNLLGNNNINIQKTNKSNAINEINNDVIDDDKKNIASLKLVMRFSKDKCDGIFDKQLFKNKFETELDYFNSEKLLSNSFSMQILTIAQQINMIEINKNSWSKYTEPKIEKVYLDCDNPTESLKLLHQNNFIMNTNAQELLQNLIRSSNFIKRNSNESYNTMIQELQDLKNWLLHESNEVIIEKLSKYYFQIENQIENETRQIQELSEQLVILKEKYNITIEEKANINRKYINLEAQCKDFINASYMVPLYYVAPLILVLIWILLEKIL